MQSCAQFACGSEAETRKKAGSSSAMEHYADMVGRIFAMDTVY
jgi:hypothetical protein